MARQELILSGKVCYVIGALKRSLAQPGWRSGRSKTLKKVIGYFENHKDSMRYDLYLQRGYPIATGVIEGACRYVVKDRMERTGMRWNKPGAEAILQLRSVAVNGDWQAFHRHRVHQERQRLYGSQLAVAA